MPSIADSDAYFSPGRLLSQHQAALVLLQSVLIDPRVVSIEWLDLACGRGQILVNLDKNLSAHLRQKVRYTGYDIDNELSRTATRCAEGMGFANCEMRVGEVSQFSDVLPPGKEFDFITLTNAVHELAPLELPGILFDCINRLSPTGCLFIYDMDRLWPLELRAVAWTAAEASSILAALLGSVGSGARPEVGEWKHQHCNGWNVQLHRSHFGIEGRLEERRNAAVDATTQQIRQLLSHKLKQTKSAIDSLARFGPQSKEEEADREMLLHNLYSLMDALGMTL